MNRKIIKTLTACITLTTGLSISTGAFCQADTLSITGKKRSLEIVEGETVRIQTPDQNIEGPLHIINDSMISIASDTIGLHQMLSIGVTQRTNRKIDGALFTGAGVAGGIGTAALAVKIANKNYAVAGGLNYVFDRVILSAIGAVSVTMTTVGIVLLCTEKNYKPNKYVYTIH